MPINGTQNGSTKFVYEQKILVRLCRVVPACYAFDKLRGPTIFRLLGAFQMLRYFCHVRFVRCHTDTVTPNKDETDVVAGRIYNQTQTIDLKDGDVTFAVSFA